MRLGRNIRGSQIPFKDEVEFSIENNFDIIQRWYQRGKISMLYENDNIKSIKKWKIPVIFHGAFDINDFDEFEDDFIKLLLKLKHKEVILHPMIKKEKVNKKTDKILLEKVLSFCSKLNELNIKVYVENNHVKMKTFYTLKQWKTFFELAPKNTELLIDLVHVMFCNDYKFLKKLIEIKYPKAIHIADTKKGMKGPKHLHLPIGEGIINFDKIFNKLLKDFDGLIIMEIQNLDNKIVMSKNKIERLIKK